MKAYHLFRKDLFSEIRNRYAINSLAMFIIVTISVILFSVGEETISDYLSGGLYWVVVFFTGMSGLARVFVSEEERGTTLTLQLIARPETVLSGKLIFNLVLTLAMNIVITFLYSALFPAFVIKSLMLFFITFILGTLGIAISSTIIAAIISKAGSKGTLYPVLSFPILLPLILILINLTKISMDGTSFGEAIMDVLFLASYDVVMLSVSYLLFDFIWKD
ncbi:MAG TPA: heme exporter protein CcmB [Ignavibacteriaceae bacterium]|jgi:heme exporter protein B|nr:heme exporter protein CcmB [Ignavibacteriaceae bacterium]HOJ19007.1 heme exporter protein CcmB [Ignavibacteriaceae bacterium]